MQILSYTIPSKYISRLQRTQNTLARVVGGSRTPNRTSNLATSSQMSFKARGFRSAVSCI